MDVVATPRAAHSLSITSSGARQTFRESSLRVGNWFQGIRADLGFEALSSAWQKGNAEMRHYRGECIED
jgi:hypothetical protein